MSGLALRRNIHDSVHGLIRLTDEEMAIIDHPLFQRLRSICQTGLLKLICPSATHTRFEHSIGVVLMADRMFDALEMASEAVSDKLYAVGSAGPGQAIRFHEVPDVERDSLRRLLRLSALVHDLGHGPLSHVFEAFAPETIGIAGFLDDPRLAPLEPCRAELLKSKTGRVTHEAVSCLMFAVIWHGLGGEPWVSGAVAAVLLGVVEAAPSSLRPWIPLLHDMISSAPIDADRMDYLLRDSERTGVSYGLYEPDRVLKSILCVRSLEVGCPSYRLGWRKSGLRAIENFVFARFEMYVQIYHHKTLRAIELMLHAIKREVERAQIAPLVRTDDLAAFLEDFGSLSDESFLGLLSGRLRPGFPGNERIAAITRQILARKLWKRIYDFHEVPPETIAAFQAGLEVAHPGRVFYVDRQPLKATKDLDRGAYLLDHDRSGCFSRSSAGLSWESASPVMGVLRRREVELVRLFMETSGPPSDAPEMTREVRLTAFRLGHTMGLAAADDRHDLP